MSKPSDWQLDQARCDIGIVIHNLQRLAEKDHSYADMLQLAQDLQNQILRRINKAAGREPGSV
jgi:hypothetical protein